MPEVSTAVDVARQIADVLERQGLPYAIGEALALGFYAPPRATVDVDVNIFVDPAGDYAELEKRRREVILLDRPIWILAPEHLAVLKLMFFRRKDLADVEAIYRDQGAALDRNQVRKTLLELVGAEEPGLDALAAIERDVDSTAGES